MRKKSKGICFICGKTAHVKDLCKTHHMAIWKRNNDNTNPERIEYTDKKAVAEYIEYRRARKSDASRPKLPFSFMKEEKDTFMRIGSTLVKKDKSVFKPNHAALAQLSAWETKYGKEFRDIPEEELVRCIRNSGFVAQTVSTYFSTMNVYADWRMYGKNQDSKYFSKLAEKYDLMNDIKNQDIRGSLVPTREKFFALLKDSNVTTRTKLAVALVYEGIETDEILTLTTDYCRSITTDEFECSNRIYKNIHSDTVGYIKEAIESGNHYKSGYKDRSEVDGEFIYRRSKITNEVRDDDTTKLDLWKYGEDLGMKFSNQYLRRNGLYHNLINIERMTNKKITEENILEQIDKHRVIKHEELTALIVRKEFKTYNRFKNYYKTELINVENFATKEIIFTEIIEEDIKLEVTSNAPRFEKSKRNDSLLGNPLGQEKITRGKLGETWILNKLENAYGGTKNVYKVEDSSGFDIEIIKNDLPHLSIEVKVVTNFSNGINITPKELDAAEERGSMYNIYVIALPKGIECLDAIPLDTAFKIINNPIKAFNINTKTLVKQFVMPTGQCVVKAGNYKITKWHSERYDTYLDIPRSE